MKPSVIEKERKDALKAKDKKSKAPPKGYQDLQDYRTQMSEQLEKFYVGEHAIPTKDIKNPPTDSANRGFNEPHCQNIATHWYRVGLMFPLKPCVVAAFNVRLDLLIYCCR